MAGNSDWELPVPSAKFRPCTWTTIMRSPARIVAQSVCYVDVRAVWRVSRVVSGIRADTVSDEQPNADRLGFYAKERSPFRVIGRLCVPPLGWSIIVARNVIYVDVRAVWRVSRVVSGIRADTVSDEQPHVDRHRLYEIEGRPCVPSLGRHTIARGTSVT